MARRPITSREAQNPENILNNLLKDYVENRLGNDQFLYRAVVVKIDQVGGVLETEPPNPKNSIKARILTDGMNSFLDDSDLTIFWPMFSHDTMPLKEGEHCYIIFEDSLKRHGLWLTRAPEPLTIQGKPVDDVNYCEGAKKFKLNKDNNSEDGYSIDKAIADTTLNITKPTVSDEFIVEENIPKFKARIGDRVIEGSNNTTIVLGRDRVTTSDTGEEKEAGSIDIVVGRNTEDVDLKEDKSMLYLTMKSDVDGNFGINVGAKSSPTAFAVLKSDEIRIVARKGMKVVVEGGDVTIEAKNIFIGKDAKEPAVLGNKFNIVWKQVLTALLGHNHPSPIPNAPSPALATFSTLDLSMPATGPVLSKTVKIKP